MLRRSGILSIPESKVNIKGRVKKFEGFKDMYAIGLLDCTDILIYNLFVFHQILTKSQNQCVLRCCVNFRPKEVTCDSCLSITRLVAGFLGQEDKRVEAVEFLASDFCINGVPEGDMEFCDVSVRYM